MYSAILSPYFTIAKHATPKASTLSAVVDVSFFKSSEPGKILPALDSPASFFPLAPALIASLLFPPYFDLRSRLVIERSNRLFESASI
jgi:hypothetical protein